MGNIICVWFIRVFCHIGIFAVDKEPFGMSQRLQQRYEFYIVVITQLGKFCQFFRCHAGGLMYTEVFGGIPLYIFDFTDNRIDFCWSEHILNQVKIGTVTCIEAQVYAADWHIRIVMNNSSGKAVALIKIFQCDQSIECSQRSRCTYNCAIGRNREIVFFFRQFRLIFDLYQCRFRYRFAFAFAGVA